MEVTVRDNESEQRFEVLADDTVAGSATYRLRAGRIAIMHTEVDSRFEGQGLASRLMAFALDSARESDLAVLPFCPYASRYIASHPEYLPLVPPAERERFGLDPATEEKENTVEHLDV